MTAENAAFCCAAVTHTARFPTGKMPVTEPAPPARLRAMALMLCGAEIGGSPLPTRTRVAVLDVIEVNDPRNTSPPPHTSETELPASHTATTVPAPMT